MGTSYTDEVKESSRSSELREQLREEGYKEFFTTANNVTRHSLWVNNHNHKVILIRERSERRPDSYPEEHDYVWWSWDIYVQLCSDNHIAKTYQALHDWTVGE